MTQGRPSEYSRRLHWDTSCSQVASPLIPNTWRPLRAEVLVCGQRRKLRSTSRTSMGNIVQTSNTTAKRSKGIIKDRIRPRFRWPLRGHRVRIDDRPAWCSCRPTRLSSTRTGAARSSDATKSSAISNEHCDAAAHIDSFETMRSVELRQVAIEGSQRNVARFAGDL
jgi:hypothetical protein